MSAAAGRHREQEESNALWDAQTVRITKNWRDVVDLPSTMDNACGGVDDKLQTGLPDYHGR